MNKALDAREWISTGEAARMLGCCYTTFRKRAPFLGIRLRVLPGSRIRKVCRADLLSAIAKLEEEEKSAVASQPPPTMPKLSRGLTKRAAYSQH